MSRKKAASKRRPVKKAESARTDSSQNLRSASSLLIMFVVCSVSLFAFSIWLPESAFNMLNENTTRMAACSLNLVGMNPVVAGRTLSQDGFAVSVITECSSLYMGILFFSFVLAYPAPLRLKLTGLPLGMALIHAGNILRIAGLFVIGVQSHALFEVTHVYFGQVLMVLFVLAVCLGWLKVCSNSKPGLLMPETEPLTRERDLFSFLIRLFAFTGVAFLLWLPLNKEYVKLADQVVTPLFSLFNYRLAIPYQHAIYYQTFNVVTFTGVVLATRIKPRTRKFGMFVAGFAVIFILHVLFRVCSVLISAFHNEPAERLAAAISICGQYILPMALWLLMVRRAKTASDLTNSHRFLNKTCMFRKN